jgi:NADPH:quinone reductase
MRAVIADRPGGPEVLCPVELPDPEPGAEQVRVAVQVAAITFMDVMRRSDSPIAPPSVFPVVFGNGVAGVVDRIGTMVDSRWLRQWMVTTTGGSGGYASLALAGAADLHVVPGQLTLAEAAAVLADGRTALGLFEAARIRSGDVVLVTAAAGGVGSLLGQLVKASGGRLIALAVSRAKLQRVQADQAVNYRDADWDRRVPEAQVVFDGIGGARTTILSRKVSPGGRYVLHGAASADKAHAAIEQRTTVGKTLLTV